MMCFIFVCEENKRFKQSCYAKEIVSNYVEIHNKNCIISKMAAKMAAEYLNLVYFCSAIRCREK